MNRGQTEYTKKKNKTVFWLLLAAVVLSLAVGGVSAYLSMASQSVTNKFTKAGYPTVTVDGASVTVDPKGYGVYLRIAVDACWKYEGKILPEEPTGYTVSSDFNKIGNYYYYPSVITKPTTIPSVVTYTAAKNGDYSLAVNVAAQIIQAVGETDDGTKTAVQDAWGVTPQQIKGS